MIIPDVQEASIFFLFKKEEELGQVGVGGLLTIPCSIIFSHQVLLILFEEANNLMHVLIDHKTDLILLHIWKTVDNFLEQAVLLDHRILLQKTRSQK